jgi:hypothetical protein
VQGTTSGSGRPTGSKPAIRPAAGRLGVLTPGLGAVATTFMAGVESIRKGHSKPIGSLTQMATIRLGKRTEQSFAADQGFRSARGPRRHRLRRVGSHSG